MDYKEKYFKVMDFVKHEREIVDVKDPVANALIKCMLDKVSIYMTKVQEE